MDYAIFIIVAAIFVALDNVKGTVSNGEYLIILLISGFALIVTIKTLVFKESYKIFENLNKKFLKNDKSVYKQILLLIFTLLPELLIGVFLFTKIYLFAHIGTFLAIVLFFCSLLEVKK